MRQPATPAFHARPGWTIAALFSVALLLAACGGGMQGSFEDELGVMRYEFRTDGSIVMTVMGASFEGEYEIDGNRITVVGPNGRLNLRRDGDALIGPMGLVLRPVSGS